MMSSAGTKGFLFSLLLFGVFLALFLALSSYPGISATLAGLVCAAGVFLKSKMSTLETALDLKKVETESLRQETSDLRKRLAGPRFKLPQRSEEQYVRVAIAGLGGTGKTSLIRKISACRLADPRKKTGFARTYSIVRETAYEDHTEVVRVDLEDYRGQNASDLLESIRRSEKEFPVTSLLLMVDLFEVAEGGSNSASEPSQGKLWDQARVDKHTREWSDQMVGILMDSLPDLRHVGLFINKADLISAPIAQYEAEIQNLFATIIQSIRARSSERLVRVYLGSALTDRMLSTLVTDWIEEAAVPLK